MTAPSVRSTLFLILGVLLSISCATASTDTLGREERRIVANVDKQIDEVVAFLQHVVDIPSATQNLDGVRRAGEGFASELAKIGFETSWAEMPTEMRRAGHLIAEHRGRRGKRILLIGHLDTVLEGASWSRDGTVASGPGTNDMKGGNVVILHALKALHDAGALRDRQIIVVFTGDEEDVGDPKETARKPLVDAAKRSDVALAFETAVGNTAVVARRGVTTWRLEASGATGHSSGIFGQNRGSGAIYEAARILNTFHDELKGEQYLTFNASVIVGGTEAELDEAAKRGSAWGKTNVIPQRVIAEGDLRFISEAQRDAAKERMQSIVTRNLPKTSAALTFHDAYPPMSPTDGNYALLAHLDRVSRALGLGEVSAYDPGARGAGDISFIASLADSLDGLGATGTGAHTPDETIDLATLPRQIKRTALLIYRLTRD
ncbi:MAG TPA: M20/M25/M40 family metallo-hydrolase [Thermoanaerobaculia bacterium]|nr:M20/M25/M40 family metallo-hydrolase [Thermoanaerobaculia bacterium]